MLTIPALLNCRRIQNGMFSNERHVTINRADGTSTAYFVSMENVVDEHLKVLHYAGTNYVRIPTSEPEPPVEIRPEDLVTQ